MKGILFLLIINSLTVNCQTLPVSANWRGFEQIQVKIGQHDGYYVKPRKALPGNPWIWRASFPEWHTEMDSLVLEKGYYLAYISVDDQYGSIYAMSIWDSFYRFLTDSLQLSSKPALEAISRGGLYALGWAKRNPDKVSCIYTETPVYDIKSWPGGRGKGIGDTTAWEQLKKVYHLSEDKALAYDDNPVDRLEGLASFKVPVLHVVGMNDSLVPVPENTGLFSERYTKLGGPVSVYPVTEGPQELYGHHFPVKHAEEYVRFIETNTYPVKKILPYKNYFNVRNGLTHFIQAIQQKKKVTVAFLGGSITFNPGWREQAIRYMKEHFPGTDFDFISAGIPSLGSLPHAFRIQRDLLDRGNIDLLFIEAAVNDRVNGTDSLTQVRDLEGIVRHAKAKYPDIDILFMAFSDPDKNHDYDTGKIPAEVANQELIAGYYQLPSINLAKEVHDKIANREFSWEDDFKDLHPAVYGQELYFQTIKDLLETCFSKATNNHSQHATKKLPAPLNSASFSDGNYYDIKHAVYDIGWKLYQDWHPEDKAATREGFVHVPVLAAEKPGATFTLSFEGTAIGIAVVSGPDAGIISYSIDGSDEKYADLYTQWSSLLHLPWYLMLESGLTNGHHRLKLKIAPDRNTQSKGNACRIVHFLINHK